MAHNIGVINNFLHVGCVDVRYTCCLFIAVTPS